MYIARNPSIAIFLAHKITDMLEIPSVLELPKDLWYIAVITD